MKFNWVTLHVKDLEKSIAFYQDVVDLPVQRRFGAPGSEIVFLGDGETKVELIAGRGNLQGFSPDISLGFAVPSVAAMIARVQTLGIPVHAGPFQPGPNIRFFYVLDPDGLQVQFSEDIQK